MRIKKLRQCVNDIGIKTVGNILTEVSKVNENTM